MLRSSSPGRSFSPPRRGSGTRATAHATTTPSSASTANTPRHDVSHTTTPATRNPAPAPTSSPLLTHPSTRPRTSAGNRSPTIDVIGGPPAAVSTPSVIRAANSSANDHAAAASPMARHQMPMHTTRIVMRRARSVRMPIGTIAMAPTIANALASRPIAALPTANSAINAGASAPSAVRSAPSSASTAAMASIAALRLGSWSADSSACSTVASGTECRCPKQRKGNPRGR